ncbi:DNA repair photolyase [Paenibacillus forsythiae]|uniref:DNA repair photolyase n=1 Tax=Paenibacillus forsythiae TaxID=365616 RepID=A0ABU3HDI7_9BACL|nr:radical SAM protein [Paenibacillus forsythiae]MDT3428879.1 DNA repair photolyase [Paenibacillus forsythiae]
MPKTYEPITSKTGMTRVKEERMPFGWSVNPYRGCSHGCSFCFARGFQGFIDKKADDEFQNHILLKMNAAEALETQLAGLARSFRHDLEAMRSEVGEVMIGTVTDPYQPIEGRTKLTRKCLMVLAKYGIRTSVTTRSPLILRDLDLLANMRSLSVNISINTLNDGLARRLEPESPLPSRRLDTVQKLTERGIRAGVFIAPILPLLTDDPSELEALFAAAADRGAESVMTSLLRLSRDVKGWYFRTLKEQFPDKLEPYRRLYADGGHAEAGYRESMSRLLDELHRKYGPAFRAAAERNASPGGYHAEEAYPRSGLTEIAGAPPVEQLSFPF